MKVPLIKQEKRLKLSDCEPHLKDVGELTMKMKLRKNKQKTARKQHGRIPPKIQELLEGKIL